MLWQAMAEPPQASRHRLQLKYWGGAMGALETLLLRAGSLESVLTSAEPVLDGARLYEILGELFVLLFSRSSRWAVSL